MCATKICALANARSIPIGLITSTRVPEHDQQSARRSKRDDDRADISPSVIPRPAKPYASNQSTSSAINLRPMRANEPGPCSGRPSGCPGYP